MFCVVLLPGGPSRAAGWQTGSLLYLFALSLHNISLQRKCGKVLQNLRLDQPQIAVAQSVRASHGHVGIFFAALQGMSYLTQSNIQLGTAAV